MANSALKPGFGGRWPTRFLGMLLALGFMMTPLTGAFAAGSSDTSDRPSSPETTKLNAARAQIEAEQYQAAIPVLQEVVTINGRNADAHNLLGFSYRKLGRYPEASEAYIKALAINPEHRGALEYQGELFLKLRQLDKAEKNLKRLDSICWLPCEEYTDLKEAVAAYKAQKGS